jgi:CDP-diacylglycerol--glycerol-3-phosphate 3-phosphatidyltransferase
MSEPEPADSRSAQVPTAAPSSVNIPNGLTVIRLFMVPLFLWLLLRDQGADTASRFWAAAVFLVASLTDLVDGELARRSGQVTTFGKVADPIADKALTGAALIGLSMLGDLPWWITIVILVREIGVTILRFWVIRDGVIPASRGGKWKTAAQMTAIVLYLLPLPDAFTPVRIIVMLAALMLTVVTGIDYVRQALRLRSGG